MTINRDKNQKSGMKESVVIRTFAPNTALVKMLWDTGRMHVRHSLPQNQRSGNLGPLLMQDNLHYPCTDASLARADEEKWRLRKKANGVSLTCNFQQILMSSILDEFCSLFLLQFHLENIILFKLFKYNFATSLMWLLITTFPTFLKEATD